MRFPGDSTWYEKGPDISSAHSAYGSRERSALPIWAFHASTLLVPLPPPPSPVLREGSHRISFEAYFYESRIIMADMEVDDVPTTTTSKGKAKDDGKEGKKRFEVKKVRLTRYHITTSSCSLLSFSYLLSVECSCFVGMGYACRSRL